MFKTLPFFLYFILLLTGCEQQVPSTNSYTIGRDATWYPLTLGKTLSVNLSAFSTALIQEMGKMEQRTLDVIDMGWIELFDNLEKKEVGGIFSSLPPTVITKDKYSFSDPFLPLGPVLVVPHSSKATSLADLGEKVVAVCQYDESVLVVQPYPTIIIEFYQDSNIALGNLIEGHYSGIVIPYLEALNLVNSLYSKEVKIVTPPLNNKALRLITLKGANHRLIKLFNTGLKRLEKSGVYQELLTTFHVTPNIEL